MNLNIHTERIIETKEQQKPKQLREKLKYLRPLHSQPICEALSFPFSVSVPLPSTHSLLIFLSGPTRRDAAMRHIHRCQVEQISLTVHWSKVKKSKRLQSGNQA